ncbi:AMP-binding enzyme, partial [Acetobacter senegalensis]
YVPSAEEIVARVNEVLGRWIGLKEVRFVRHLPTTVSGKITRKRLLVS